MTEKPSKPTVRRTRTRKPKVEPRQPSHGEIAERAYYLYLEEAGVDELELAEGRGRVGRRLVPSPGRAGAGRPSGRLGQAKVAARTAAE